ncbi:hypothetical protein CKALI_08195 [Corynebacterium kalinowskii]|uniref:Uncharacterized protein n=1 Tax=Corynebacterium kalinowskii TaxID=2675216 RepID=A0A6B8VHL4_9CORY|nr:DUF6882 domain-containing protein [Corynebacterium kalinowskii]QGU02499.1 hypothetical protein CKALI_08195 [Corynebacterium kalinowskii]
MLENPNSISEVAWDGYIDRVDVDFNFQALLGEVLSREINQNSEGFQVRFQRRGGADLTFPADLVAEVDEGHLTWQSTRIAEAASVFGIPELIGTHQMQPELISAARTIYQNAPIIEVPFHDRTVVLALQGDWLRSNPQRALLQATAAETPAAHLDRCLEVFAAVRELPETPVLTRRDGAVYDIAGGLSLDDVRADAFYFAEEHRLFFEAIYPNPRAYFDPASGQAHLTSAEKTPLTCTATLLAVVEDDVWTATHALPYFARSQAASRARAILDFGYANNIPALVARTMPAQRAFDWDLIDVAKPIVGIWTHAFAPLSPTAYAVLLVDHPALRLPAPQPERVAAMKERQVPAGVDKQRALAAYDRFRMGRS